MSMSKKNVFTFLKNVGIVFLWHKDAANKHTVMFNVLKVESKGIILEREGGEKKKKKKGIILE